MKRYPILEVCARIEGHAVQRHMLHEYCRDFDDWQGLLERAEREGMTPLLQKHLQESEADIPATVRRSLNLLYKRHQKNARVRLQVLEEILKLFQEHLLTPILIKGAALCLTLYPDPALRPMRDMDILFSTEQVNHAKELLRRSRFEQSTAPIPPDHHHLPPLYKTVDGMAVCIELHRGLFPGCPPYYPQVQFEKLLKESKRLKVGNTVVSTFGDEDMLHYLYQHAFHAPLTYESYKLINAADIISFTEINYATLNWNRIQKDFPLLFNALPLLHHISPWNLNKIPADFVPLKLRQKRLAPTSFTGWPYKRLREQKVKGRKWYQILFDTFWPPSWWLQIYYGTDTRREHLWCLLLRHPRHIFWWARLYSSFKK